MKLRKDPHDLYIVKYRDCFVFNDSQWCGWSGSGICCNRKRHIWDDWKNMYRATGVPSNCPEWDWGRGEE